MSNIDKTDHLSEQTKEHMEKQGDPSEKKQQKEGGDIKSYKQQIKQHVVTICVLEERLDKLLQKNKDYHAEVGTLKKAVVELTRQPKLEAPPKPKMIKQSPAQDATDLEQANVQLKSENKDYKQQVQSLQDVITSLSSRLNDAKKEMDEGQKKKMEKNKRLIRDQKEEVLALRQRLSKLAQIADKKETEAKGLTDDLGKYKSAFNKYKSLAADREAKVKQLEEQLKVEQEDAKKQLGVLQEEGRITSELTSLGAQCRGERHEQIISNQREALSELRTKIRSLEQNLSPPSKRDSAMVILLKKELAELRANHAINDDSISISTLEQQVNIARGLEPGEAQTERAAHRETQESLELTENSFLSMLRAVSGILEMDQNGGLRSMAHVPKNERARLYSEREKACELIKRKLRILKESIANREERLKNHERDLAKLRQAEQLVEHQKSQIEHLGTEVRNKTEETEYLRESLNRVRQQLDEEKRTAAAIKLKKIPNGDVTGWRKHNCVLNDPMGFNCIRKKESKEMMKRKNFEIISLKTELANRDKQLDATRKKLDIIQPELVTVEKLPIVPVT